MLYNYPEIEINAMIVLGSFALLRPYWLLCLPVLWLFLKLTRSLDLSLGDWPRAIDPPLLDALLGGYRKETQENHGLTMVWCIAVIVISLAGPALRVAVANQFRNLDAALIVMNISGSSNLSKITSAAQIVLNGSGARQSGLLLYAGEAYLASPLTYDLASIEALVFGVDDQTIPDGGARPDRALGLAHHLLHRMNIFAGDVVLISDGAGIDSQTYEEAKLLAADGHSLHTLFIPASEEHDRNYTLLQAKMKQLASEGHGLAGESATALHIADAIASRRIEHVVKGSRQALEWFDLGRLMILLAAAPLLISVRRGAL
jgi:Ca-activated chloride channel family protein